MLEGLKLLSITIGLQVNPVKSSIYSYGLDQQNKDEIANRSGLNFDQLPFKYLGVSISARKIKVGDCNLLVEKIMAKIKVWSSRHLSLVGRMLMNDIYVALSLGILSLFRCFY